jgi:nucleoside-diphosphate-sugar epimerase
MILVTGATGFIGREVARRLLAGGRVVAILARPRGRTPARERVSAVLGVAAEPVVEGDLALPGCGLTAADWRWLRARVELVVHCAGDARFAPGAPDAFRAGHVEGPRRLLERLAGGRLRRWVQLSTAYVCGVRAGTVLESEGDVGQAFHNEYERTKLDAEAALRRAARPARVDLRVLRPSIVVGPAAPTTGGTPARLLIEFIRLLATLARRTGRAADPLRIEAAPEAPFNVVPVEHVAAACCALAEHPSATGGTFHVIARDAPPQAAVLRALCRRLGVEGVTLVDGRRELIPDPSWLERQLARRLLPYRPYLLGAVRFDDRHGRRALAAAGLAPPRLSRAWLDRLVEQALAGTEPAHDVAAAS